MNGRRLPSQSRSASQFWLGQTNTSTQRSQTTKSSSPNRKSAKSRRLILLSLLAHLLVNASTHPSRSLFVFDFFPIQAFRGEQIGVEFFSKQDSVLFLRDKTDALDYDAVLGVHLARSLHQIFSDRQDDEVGKGDSI